jgi:nitronate monooxygenase
MWPDRRIIDLFKTEFPIVLAPMAGVMDAELVIAAAQGGALGSLPCAMLSAEKARERSTSSASVSAPVNMNYFCHTAVDADPRAKLDGRQAWILLQGWARSRASSAPPTARRSMKPCALWWRN